MKKFVLDTNLYIRADRSIRGRDEVAAFYEAWLPGTYLHAVVARELMVGGTDSRRRARIRRALIAPFERRRRVVVPSPRSWVRSGEVVGRLVERGTIAPGGFSRSFLNDALLACSCREEGLILITENTSDFDRIAEVERFDYVPPWPSE